MKLTDKKRIGDYYEEVACHYLLKQGLLLLAKNSQCRFGELDLVMQERTCLVFVEVRYRKNNHFGTAAMTVTPNKQAKIIKAAQLWMISQQLNPEQTEFRFDLFAVTGREQEWIKNAF
ncbi:YraN family protein [Orbaceae bacterium ESL0721]|nr:YraN family protein [Orbaceae bacterium ESL0721]